MLSGGAAECAGQTLPQTTNSGEFLSRKQFVYMKFSVVFALTILDFFRSVLIPVALFTRT
jgi:hypothetical protein